MVGYQHEVAGVEGRVHAAGGVGQEQYLRAQLLHEPRRQHYVVYAVALVVVHAALHADDGRLAEIAEDELAGMSRHGGDGEAGDVCIRHLALDLQVDGEASQPAAQHQSRLGHEIRPSADIVAAAYQLFVTLIHCQPSITCRFLTVSSLMCSMMEYACGSI